MLGRILDLFTGGLGAQIGHGVAVTAIAAAVAPALIWVYDHRDVGVVSFTLGQLACFGLVLAVILAVLWLTRSPRT